MDWRRLTALRKLNHWSKLAQTFANSMNGTTARGNMPPADVGETGALRALDPTTHSYDLGLALAAIGQVGERSLSS